VAAILLAGLFFVVLINMIVKADADNLPWITHAPTINNVIKPNDDITGNIGVNLMSQYLLPFEALSILLMMALIGAAHLSRKEPQH
jgi:NADH:ubiquinone oxidoreductase subunit 6 (subunit J)